MTPTERKERRRGWLTLLAVVAISGALFFLLWLAMVVLYLIDPGPSID